MVYIKSTLIGLLTGATAMVATTILVMVIGYYQVRKQVPDGEIGFDLRSIVVSSPLLYLAAIAGFAIGFYWRYRRG